MPILILIPNLTSGSGDLTITGALYTDLDTFYAATVTGGNQSITGALYADTDTFYGSTLTNVPSGIFVATTGSDANAGTLASPKKTIQGAYAIAVAGDTIFLRGGTWSDLIGSHLTGRSGTLANPITITNYPGEHAIIDGIDFNATGGADDGYPSATAAKGAIINVWRVSYIHILGTPVFVGGVWRCGIWLYQFPTYGVHIMGGTTQGATTNGNWVKGCEISNGGWGSNWEGKGIGGFFYQAGTEMDDNDIHHNKDLNEDNADSIQYMGLGAGNTGTTIRRNRMAYNSDDGLDMFNTQAGTTVAPVLVEGNWVYYNGYEDDGVTPSTGDGNGFKLGGGGGSGGHTVQNNIAWANRVDGFQENSAQVSMELYNNTSYNNEGHNYYFGDNIVNHTLKNNITYLTGLANNFSGDTNTFNSWNLGVTVSGADFVSLSDTVAKGPRNSDGSLPNTTFLTLVSGSDLIDVGTDVGIPFSGAAPDLGWKEFTSGLTITGALYAEPDVFFTSVVTRGVVSITGALYSDADTFYGSVVTRGSVTITGALYTDADTFFASVTTPGVAAITGALYSDPDTFFASAIIPDTLPITGALYSDPDTFFNSVVTRGSVAITGSLYSDPDTFFASTTTIGPVVITGALYIDPDTFYGSVTTVGSVAITGALYTDPDTFFAANVSAAGLVVSGNIYIDPDTFYSSTLSTVGTISANLYTDADTFPAATVTSISLVAGALYSDLDTFYGALISSAYTLNAVQYNDPDIFYSSILTGGTITSGGGSGLPLWVRRRRRRSSHHGSV